MSREFLLRANTGDYNAWHEVIVRNEYAVRDLRDQTILDIGAHIGCFSLKATQFGAPQIIAFEPEESNYELAKANMAENPICTLKHAAVWRSDKREDTILLDQTAYNVNNGACPTCVTGVGVAVKALALDDLIIEYNPTMIKIDVECSEYPILYTSNELARINIIVGEVHNVEDPRTGTLVAPTWADFKGRLNDASLMNFLREQGFHIATRRAPNSFLGLFWAVRTLDAFTTIFNFSRR